MTQDHTDEASTSTEVLDRPEKLKGPAVEYRKTGRIVIHDDEAGRHWDLRRPRFGEFKKIKAAFFLLTEEITTITERHGLTGVDLSDPEVMIEYGAAADAMNDEIIERTADVLIKAMKKLNTSKYEIPEPDDLPTWLVLDQSILRRAMTHWRTVPLDRG